MRKIDKKVSLQGQKRYAKNLARKQRREAELNMHTDWLETLMKAGKELDMDKLMYKMVDEQKVLRDPNRTKLILDRLVSRNVK